MKIFTGIKFPLFMLVTAGTIAVLFLPFFPIDETRYLTVAWEMKLNHSIVPLLHGSPYSHKPPFLFALINLDWFLLGMNEKTLRFIPVLFSLLNILMTYRIAFVLWKDKKIAYYAAAILASTMIYLVWSTLIMFDIILTFFVLVGIYGFLSATRHNFKTSLTLVSISIGGGLLTKGPVVFAHILPVSILYFIWKSKNRSETKRWYSLILLSVLTGAAISLLWAFPAAIKGGGAYREAIFWGQTADRIVSSFSHQRPIWWYIPLLPGLFFPWVLVKPAWHGFSQIRHDESYRFLVVWILATIAIFSLISGKQIYYLIPMLPAVSLLIAKNILLFDMKFSECSRPHYPVAIFYSIAGVLILCTSYLKTGSDFDSTLMGFAAILGCVFICLGSIIFFMKPLSMDKLVKIIALSSLAVLITVVIIGSVNFFNRYDVSSFAGILREKQEEGYNIIHYKEYDGQYQFLGRLTQPLIVLSNKKSVGEYAETHKNLLLITYEEPEKDINKNDVLYQQLYRGKKVLLLGEKGIQHFLEPEKYGINNRDPGNMVWH
ncbi:MAG: phospholipid carrier-dependent glycosyltransferase [Desulfobacteraceae bacterium]|jgi:hypothetical protein